MRFTDNVTIKLYSTAAARSMTAKLVQKSAWYEITPLPDDEYEVEVRGDVAASLLDRTFMVQVEAGKLTLQQAMNQACEVTRIALKGVAGE